MSLAPRPQSGCRRLAVSAALGLLLASANAIAAAAQPLAVPSLAAPAVPPGVEPLVDPSASAGVVRGVVKASEEIVLSSRLSARIAEMPFKEGQRFERGKPLVVFDCTQLRAQARAARAANRADETLVNQNTELDRYQAIGRNELEITRARFDQSAAESAALEAQLRDCRVLAPFAGLVVENLSRRHELAAPGKDLLRIINDETLEIHLVAPSAWLSWLRPGTPFLFRVDETGALQQARVERTGASVDPVSQTIRVVGQIEGQGRGAANSILPGMSGQARFDEAAARVRAQAPAPAPLPTPALGSTMARNGSAP